jgi:hypothetical protein
MSKTKSPQEKKRLSLERDRRNTYGENSKASRKNIPRRKKCSRMAQRRAVGAVLAQISVSVDEQQATDAELLATHRSIAKKRQSFKKQPDTPLGQVLARRAKRAEAVRAPRRQP